MFSSVTLESVLSLLYAAGSSYNDSRNTDEDGCFIPGGNQLKGHTCIVSNGVIDFGRQKKEGGIT